MAGVYGLFPQGVRMNYVLMMPVLNEKEHIQQTINSILNQIIKPLTFIIIDGGSTDGTWELLMEYHEKYKWVVPITQTNYQGEPGHKKISCAMVEAYEYLDFEKYKSIKYIGHIDADFQLNSDVFAKLIVEMETDEKVGAVGGTLYTDSKPEVYPEDELPNMRLYRKEALDQIGGYQYSRYSWDSVILAKLRMAGWKIKQCPEAKVINLRIGENSSKNKWTTAVSYGKARYYLGYSLPLFLAGTAYSTKNNGLVFGAGLMAGYFGALGTSRTKDEQVLNYYQNERLGELLSRNQ
jgi:poly-beta-1,6-N-acetyl-D-glucosamine synthase